MSVQEIKVELVGQSPYQNRKGMGAINELAASIGAQGLIQPIVVRPANGNRYELVCGERRLLAVKSLGVDTILADVRIGMTDREAKEIILAENLEREALTPMEEAIGLQTLRDAGMDITAIGESLGRGQKWVARRVSLLELAPE